MEHGLHVPVLPGLLYHAVHIGFHAGEPGEVGVHVCLGLRHRDPQILGQGKGGDAVHDAEVYRLGRPAHVGRHLLNRHPEHMGGGDGMEILTGEERLLHGLVPGDVGQQPQLDLTVVRVH